LLKNQILKKHIPNAITSANLFMGCLAIIAALENNLETAAWLIVGSAIADFFDGFAARLLKVHSEIGKQLDSLADVVSFGVAPGMIFYMLSQEYLYFGNDFPQFVPLILTLSYLPFLIPIFSAVRLAKFNLDTRQTDSFIGVPTPANALFIISIPFVLHSGPDWAETIFSSRYFIIAFPIISSWLLVAELPLFALKFKSFGWKGNEVRISFIAISVALLLVFKFFGISLSILLYVLLSTYLHYTRKS
jgi:CDP-diacylglycerol--serine O-phosphatidyltransferase